MSHDLASAFLERSRYYLGLEYPGKIRLATIRFDAWLLGLSRLTTQPSSMMNAAEKVKS